MKLCCGIIATNEEQMLTRFLPSLSAMFNGDVVAIDYGSTDKTGELFKKYCKVVETRDWPNDFGIAKTNVVQLAERAGYEWMFLLDADEMISLSDLRTVKYCIENNNYTSYCCGRIHYSKENVICAGKLEFPDPQARIFKLNEGYYYKNVRHCSLYKEGDFLTVWEMATFAWVPIFIKHYRMLKPVEDLKTAEIKRAIMEGKPTENLVTDTEAHVPLIIDI